MEEREREEARKTRREKESRDRKERAETERKERVGRKDRENIERKNKENKEKRDLDDMMEASFGSSDDSHLDPGSRPSIGEEVRPSIERTPQIGGV